MTASIDDSLAKRFESFLNGLGVEKSLIDLVWRDLGLAYTAESRYYHNLDHVGSMLSALDETRLVNPEVECAIWFHDVVYDSQRQDNEFQSAEWFKGRLGDSLSPDLVDSVCRLILATDPSLERTGRDDENLLIDVDLGILGSNSAKYGAYSAAVRKEYAWVPEEDYRIGRSKVLQKFLKSQIYRTNEFILLEAQARFNLEQELANYRESPL